MVPSAALDGPDRLRGTMGAPMSTKGTDHIGSTEYMIWMIGSRSGCGSPMEERKERSRLPKLKGIL